jgi:hypothetical protein
MGPLFQILIIQSRYVTWFSSVPPPITVAARSKVLSVTDRSNVAIVGSSPTKGMDVRVYSVLVL